MGFKDILDWLRANDMGDLAIKVAEMGIDDMDSLRATDITTFQEHGLDHLSTRRIWECLHGPDVLVIHESETVTSRPDLPVVHARGRGSMKRALDRTITNDEDQLIIDLENDMYAQSSKKPREALWKTWCVMASAWNLPPVPLTEELIDATLICCWWLLRGIEAAAATTLDNSHRKDNIPDSTGPENRFSRCLCSSRTLLHLPISPTFPTHLSTPRDEETPGQDAQVERRAPSCQTPWSLPSYRVDRVIDAFLLPLTGQPWKIVAQNRQTWASFLPRWLVHASE